VADNRDGLSVNQNPMLTPPLHTADIRTEPFPLSVRRLLHGFPAIVAPADFLLPVNPVSPAEAVPLAEGLYRVHGEVQAFGDCAVAFPHHAQVGDLFFLSARHIDYPL